MCVTAGIMVTSPTIASSAFRFESYYDYSPVHRCSNLLRRNEHQLYGWV